GIPSVSSCIAVCWPLSGMMRCTSLTAQTLRRGKGVARLSEQKVGERERDHGQRAEILRHEPRAWAACLTARLAAGRLGDRHAGTGACTAGFNKPLLGRHFQASAFISPRNTALFPRHAWTRGVDGWTCPSLNRLDILWT